MCVTLNVAAENNYRMALRHYLLSLHKEWSSVPYAKGDKKGSIEASLLSI